MNTIFLKNLFPRLFSVSLLLLQLLFTTTTLRQVFPNPHQDLLTTRMTGNFKQSPEVQHQEKLLSESLTGHLEDQELLLITSSGPAAEHQGKYY